MTDRRQGIQREDIFQEVQEMRNDFVEHDKEDAERAQRMEAYHNRFDRHLEIYADNNKEMKRLADNIEKMQSKVNEMFEPYRDAKGVARSIKWGVGILLGLSGVVGAIKYLIKF